LTDGGVSAPDVAVVGGGIVGTAAAAVLAATGAAVELFERARLADAASGRNSGAVQHPFDATLAALHHETLDLYAELGQEETGFVLPDEPAGVLMLGHERQPLVSAAAQIRRVAPELRAELAEGDELARLEPALTPGLTACRLATGYTVRPASATLAFAELARRRGATIHEGAVASPWIEESRLVGVVVDGERRAAGEVLVAAGPWTPEVVDPSRRWRPIERIWGVNVEIALDAPPRHVLEEAGVEEVAAGGTDAIFSLVTAGGASSLGSTFLPDEPRPERFAPRLRERGATFVPALREAAIVSSRACARPQSVDGRPLVGPVAGIEGLHVAAGHGPWGISLGPATARMAADVVLGRGDAIPPPLATARMSAPRA
jgi:glycine/D-amino acid oxidase-like deaminating enzyme